MNHGRNDVVSGTEKSPVERSLRRPGPRSPSDRQRGKLETEGHRRLKDFKDYGWLLPALVSLLFGLSCNGGGSLGDNGLVERSDATATVGIAPSATATVGAVPSATARPTSTLPPLPEGDRIRIQKISVDAALVTRVVGLDGQTPEAGGPDDATLQDFSQHWPNYGGAPGEGNLVITGSVDSGTEPCKQGTVPPPCHAVFWDLNRLTVGDSIEVFLTGKRAEYNVALVCTVPVLTADWDSIFAETDRAILTLVTSTGQFVNGAYVDRLIVIAEEQPRSAPASCPRQSIRPSGGQDASGSSSATAQSVVFRARLQPGSLPGPLSPYVVYEFALVGYSGPPRPEDGVRLAPPLPGAGSNGTVGWSRDHDLIHIPFPSNAAPGTYELSVQISGGSEASVTFEHASE
jgi:hypothetical protein